MKNLFIAALLICLFNSAGCNKTPENKTDKPKTEDIRKQDPQFFSGGGKKSQTINLKKGMAAFEYSYNHSDTLTITIMDTNQTVIGVVLNKDGKITDGLDRINIPVDGKYILEIKGSGRWHINIW